MLLQNVSFVMFDYNNAITCRDFYLMMLIDEIDIVILITRLFHKGKIFSLCYSIFVVFIVFRYLKRQKIILKSGFKWIRFLIPCHSLIQVCFVVNI